MLRSVLCCALMLLAGSANSHAQSPYLSGKGMGLAKAAELNGYPGPAHVLELAVELELTAEQRAKSEALFQRTRSSAIALGKELVKEERALDELFASRSIDAPALASSLARIGKLQSQLRQVHLGAHLEQAALLSSEQIARYSQLRGYGASGGHGGHGGRSH